MKVLKYILLITLFTHTICQAQQDLIFFSKEDSAIVKIDKKSLLTPNTIIYQENDGKKKTAEASSIIGFSLNDGATFRSIEKSSNSFVFMEEVVSGPVSLLQQFDTEEFYFIKNEELILIENSFLDGRIKILLEDCADWKNSVKGDAAYTEAYLKPATIAYNICVDPNYKPKEDKAEKVGGIKITKGIKIAYNHNQVQFNYPRSAHYEGDAKGRPGFQVGAMVLLESEKSPISFQFELNYSQKASDVSNDFSIAFQNFSSALSYRVSYISFPVILKYNLINKRTTKFQPFIHAGFDNGILIGQNIEESELRLSLSTEFGDNVKKFESGFLAGFGISKQLQNSDALDFELRYSNTFFKLSFPEQVVVNKLLAFSIIYRR